MDADAVVDRAEDNQSGLIQGDKMKQSGRTTLFVLVCIAVLTAAYGVGVGVRKLRVEGILNIPVGANTEKPPNKPKLKSDQAEVAADTGDAPEPAKGEEPTAEPSEEQQEELTARPERPDVMAMKERFQAMSEEEQQEALAKRRKFNADNGRGEGRGKGTYQQLTEEEQSSYREKMEALGAKAKSGELSEEEMRQARGELMKEYGITPQGRGGRRPGGRQ
jgi:hypothetical protein